MSSAQDRAAPRVVHVVAGLAREDGGPAYSVPSLAAALTTGGADVVVRTLRDDRAEVGGSGAQIARYAAAPSRWGRLVRGSMGLSQAIQRDAAEGAVLHAHGLWLMPNVYPARALRRAGKPAVLVHSPRGMLAQAALEISSWKKRPFWWLFQRKALAAADCLHATAESELEEIRLAGLRNPVAVVPNGVDIPTDPIRPGPMRGQTVLSLGRIHPKKGLTDLVRAWARIEASRPGWRLRIVGPSERGHDAELRSLIGRLGLKSVSVEGPLYGAERQDAYREAAIFVLASRNENFGMTVAEALAAGTPVISTKGAPWGGLIDERCGWWVDHGPESLASALLSAIATPDGERSAMGARGRAWMERDYSWDAVAATMLDVYGWLRHGGAPPPAVHLH